MTTMQAKFAGKCGKCGRAIRVGDPIDWSRDSGARHLSCLGAAGDARARATPVRTPAAPRKAGTHDGAVEQLQSWEDGRPVASKEIGRTFRVGKRGGKVAGQIVTVIGAEVGDRVSAEDAEDMGHYDGGGYPLTTWVRLATEAEAAPILAAEQAKAQVATARAELRRRHDEGLRQHGDSLPPQREGGTLYSLATACGETTTTVSVTLYADGSAVWYHGGYYDDYRSTWGVTQDAAEVLALLGQAGIAQSQEGA